MKLKDYEFGFADAEKEFLRIPALFETAFYDPKEIVQNLVDGYAFLLIGRKGTGKSAYNARIKTISKKDSNLNAFSISLNDFDFSTFAKTSINDEISGTNKYKHSWDFLLLLTFCKVIYNKLKITEVESFNNVIKLLNKMGFVLDDEEYKKDVKKLAKIKMGVNVKIIDVSIEAECGVKPDNYQDRLTAPNELILDSLKEIYFNERKILILIDGLDDILRFKKDKLAVLASLVRSADYLNVKFEERKIPLKIVIFIREDIIFSINDPDFNKIRRDGGITLNWYSGLEDLKSIVNLRFKLSNIPEKEIETHWDTIFPRKIKNKSSWEYIIDHTLGKPRDILQFLQTCKELYPNKEFLSIGEVQDVLKVYSREYLLEEMKNELSGFVDEEIINSLQAVFQRLGNIPFKFQQFVTIVNEVVTKETNIEQIKELIYLLFNAGYVGQRINNSDIGKDSVVFKYRNPAATVNLGETFIIHKGLFRGIGIRQ